MKIRRKINVSKNIQYSHTFRFVNILTHSTYLRGRCVLEFGTGFGFFGGFKESA